MGNTHIVFVLRFRFHAYLGHSSYFRKKLDPYSVRLNNVSNDQGVNGFFDITAHLCFSGLPDVVDSQ